MFRLVKTDINILIHKKGFQVAFLLILAYALGVTLVYARLQQGSDVSEMYHPLKVSGLNSVSDYKWFFYKYFPFLIILPAGFTVFNDEKTRINVLIKARSGNKRYYASKLIAAFIVTFLVIYIPFLLQAVVNHIIFPMGANADLTNWETYSEVYFIYADAYLLSGLYYENIYLYFLAALALTGVFSGCLAVFLVGLSTFGMKYKAFLFLPVYLVLWFLDRMVSYVKSFDVNICEYMTLFDITANKKIIYYIAIMVVLAAMGVIFTVINANKRERVS